VLHYILKKAYITLPVISSAQSFVKDR